MKAKTHLAKCEELQQRGHNLVRQLGRQPPRDAAHTLGGGPAHDGVLVPEAGEQLLDDLLDLVRNIVLLVILSVLLHGVHFLLGRVQVQSQRPATALVSPAGKLGLQKDHSQPLYQL